VATVPGGSGNGPVRDPYGGIPPGLRPTEADILRAVAIMHGQGKFQQLAGDVVPFPKRTPLSPQPGQSVESYGEDLKKTQTRDVLSRVLGGTQNVLPMIPKGD
jgi:hypothetical protein